MTEAMSRTLCWLSGSRESSCGIGMLTCLPGYCPIQEILNPTELPLREMGQVADERLVVQGMGDRDRCPGRIALAVPQAQELMLDVGVGAVDDAVAVQVAAGAAVPDLQAGRGAHLQAAGLLAIRDPYHVDCAL